MRSRGVTYAAGILIVDAVGHVLVVHENYPPRRWTLPGGRIEQGESPKEAASREIDEETGFDVDVGGLLGIYFIRRQEPGLRFVFVGKVAEPCPAVLYPPDELDDARWIAPSELPSPSAESLRLAVSDYVAGRRGQYQEVLGDAGSHEG